MQDGINNNATYKFNSNNNNYTYMYYSNSEVKPILENWYQTNIGNNKKIANKVVNGNYYCEQAKTKYHSSYTSGNAIMTTYTSYDPNFKCSTDGNNKGLVNSSVGLLNYDELVYAGGYYGESDGNYYLNNNNYFWTMSPAGFSVNLQISTAWVLQGLTFNLNVNGTYILRPVVIFNANTKISDGDGTKDNPFIVE